MIKELRRRFPGANISAIDYDPGSSEVNQLNRLKLLLSNAPAGRHPDENDDGVIVNPDGTKTRPVVKLAEGAGTFTDTEPVSSAEVPLERADVETVSEIVMKSED